MKKVLVTATVQSHLAQFHKPLIEMLKTKGYEVHAAARNNLIDKDGLQLKESDKTFDIAFERSPFNKNNLKAYKELKKLMLDYKYDIVHCNTPIAGLITRLAARPLRKTGTKVIYTAHGFHFYKGAPLKNWLLYYPIEKCLAHLTDKIITINQEDYCLASAKFASQIFFVHGTGVNTRKYNIISKGDKDKLRRELGYLSEHFIILCVGELNKNKNQGTIIRAIAKVRESVPEVKLLLAGDGLMEQTLKNLTDSLGMNDVVDFLGYRNDLERYLNICDVSVSASFREGLPLNVMEAMLCEKSIIASLNRGHKELIKDGVTGYLLKPEDSLGFCCRILELYSSEKLRNDFGQAGRLAVQPFIEEAVLDELKLVYEVQ
ncbi:MAG: glycosyltransferase family 4 protein [Clostridia bacterium]|nr:glycosyltransferase family 4 protein [Clostridia bacterium]